MRAGCAATLDWGDAPPEGAGFGWPRGGQRHAGDGAGSGALARRRVGPRRHPEAERVAALVAAARQVDAEALWQANRGVAELALARQLWMYLLCTALGFTQTEVARMAGRDRSTVHHACRLIEDRRDEAGFERQIAALESQLARDASEGGHAQAR
jgi:hypothetical protein